MNYNRCFNFGFALISMRMYFVIPITHNCLVQGEREPLEDAEEFRPDAKPTASRKRRRTCRANGDDDIKFPRCDRDAQLLHKNKIPPIARVIYDVLLKVGIYRTAVSTRWRIGEI